MAFSQPLTDSVRRKGQSAMLCQLCENDPKLKWKCLDCELMMCQRCRDKVHPKFPSANTHTIIDLKDISKHKIDSESKPDLTRIKCRGHGDQNCCLYCKTCKEFVCQTCITKTHNEHEFGDIIDEYRIKIEKIRNGQKTIELKMQTLTVSEQKLKQMKSTEQLNYDKVKKEILDDDKALKDEIQKHTDKLLTELVQKYSTVSKTFENEGEKLRNYQNQIKKIVQEINNFLQPSNAKEMFSGYDSLLKSMEINNPQVNTSFQGVPEFIEGDKAKIQLILGKLQNTIIRYNAEDTSIPYNTKLQVDKRFESDLKYIDSAVSCPDGSLWICDHISDRVQKVNTSGDSINVISDFKTNVYDAALLPSGDLLFSDVLASNLKLISSGSTAIQNSVYKLSPLRPLGIHVTCDNKVIVGAEGGKSIFPVDGPRQVIVMDQTGHHQKVFQYDRHGKPLFNYPYRITSNSQGNIAVADKISDDNRGRIILLNPEEEVINIYKGHLDVNNGDNSFIPKAIITSPLDNFVVADYNNHTLHLLNSEGQIITFYNMKEMDILLPRSLSFSTTGQLFIGCWTYGHKDKNAVVFVINNFLF